MFAKNANQNPKTEPVQPKQEPLPPIAPPYANPDTHFDPDFHTKAEEKGPANNHQLNPFPGWEFIVDL